MATASDAHSMRRRLYMNSPAAISSRPAAQYAPSCGRPRTVQPAVCGVLTAPLPATVISAVPTSVQKTLKKFVA